MKNIKTSTKKKNLMIEAEKLHEKLSNMNTSKLTDKEYIRLDSILWKAFRRVNRRNNSYYNFIKGLEITKKRIEKKVKTVGRPKLDKETKKKAISIKLSPKIIKWMDRQAEKRPELIETALKNYYQIPDFIETNE